MTAAFALAPALVLGSFLNVVIVRVPQRRSLGGRSACPACSAPIAWYDNVPVLSYLWLAGRCRTCRVRISPLYPAIELLTATLVVASIWHFGLTPYGVLAAAFCVVLVTLAAIDLRHHIVPNRIVVPAAVITLVVHTALDPGFEWLLGALAAATFLFVFVLAYPAGLGMGDVKLAFLLGAMLGSTVGLALMLGFLAALVPSVILFVRHGAQARKMALPLAPFLALGALVALGVGNPLLGGYVDLFR